MDIDFVTISLNCLDFKNILFTYVHNIYPPEHKKGNAIFALCWIFIPDLTKQENCGGSIMMWAGVSHRPCLHPLTLHFTRDTIL